MKEDSEREGAGERKNECAFSSREGRGAGKPLNDQAGDELELISYRSQQAGKQATLEGHIFEPATITDDDKWPQWGEPFAAGDKCFLLLLEGCGQGQSAKEAKAAADATASMEPLIADNEHTLAGTPASPSPPPPLNRPSYLSADERKCHVLPLSLEQWCSIMDTCIIIIIKHHWWQRWRW